MTKTAPYVATMTRISMFVALDTMEETAAKTVTDTEVMVILRANASSSWAELSGTMRAMISMGTITLRLTDEC